MIAGEGLQHVVEEGFRRRFGAECSWIVRSPGRVNLIGEHTDYNQGYVLPMAIDRGIWIALRARGDRTVHAWSLDLVGEAAFSLDRLHRGPAGWTEYPKGVAWALQETGGPLTGWEGVVAGNVPIGAGLSSSAALEMAVARAFAAVSGMAWDPAAMARSCQKAENEWVGVRCGIMDQLTAGAGRDGHALLIDCRTLAIRPVALAPGSAVVILDTGTRRGLAGSAYNQRRAACEAASRFFGAAALRDVSLERLEREGRGLDDSSYRRARHVISENNRTLSAAQALERGDAPAMGALMTQSHASLRDDFEVSSRELDLIVELAAAHPACHGARMTGAGFGGCAVALVAASQAAGFTESIARQYRDRAGREPRLIPVAASGGTQLVDLRV